MIESIFIDLVFYHGIVFSLIVSNVNIISPQDLTTLHSSPNWGCKRVR